MVNREIQSSETTERPDSFSFGGSGKVDGPQPPITQVVRSLGTNGSGHHEVNTLQFASSAPRAVDTVPVRSTVFDGPVTGELDVPVAIQPTREREIFKTERGCVVRALGSALRAEAVESEWEQRANQMDDAGPYANFEAEHPNLTEKQKDFVRGQKIAYADAKVADLIREYRYHDSPLGNALRDREVEEYGRQDVTGIRQLLEAGRDVTIIGRVDNGNRHMVHVSLDDQGNLIALSDAGNVIELDGEYTTIAFADKGATPVELPVRENFSPSQLPHLNETIRYKQSK